MAEVVWKEIPTSSNVKRIGWQENPPAMLVEWSKGRTSEYAGVEEKKFEQIANAPSVGSAIAEQIKGHYSHRYVG